MSCIIQEHYFTGMVKFSRENIQGAFVVTTELSEGNFQPLSSVVPEPFPIILIFLAVKCVINRLILLHCCD